MNNNQLHQPDWFDSRVKAERQRISNMLVARVPQQQVEAKAATV
jgi:hypothetical protein